MTDVLPSERLLANGVAIPELRSRFRAISNWRNVRAVVMAWAWLFALAYLGTHASWLGALIAFVAMGPIHAIYDAAYCATPLVYRAGRTSKFCCSPSRNRPAAHLRATSWVCNS